MKISGKNVVIFFDTNGDPIPLSYDGNFSLEETFNSSTLKVSTSPLNNGEFYPHYKNLKGIKYVIHIIKLRFY